MRQTAHADDRRGVLVVMPAELKAEIVRRVEAEDTNINDVAVGALAKRFKVRSTPSGLRSYPRADTLSVVLRMPHALKLRLQRRALLNETNLTHTVVEELCAAFELTTALSTPVRRSPFGGGARRR